jgi:hypothetical protein
MRGHSYEVELPSWMKMNNVFHADRLRRHPTESMPGQIQDPPQPIVIDGKPEWEVAGILASKIVRGILKYKASWVGCDPDDQYYAAHSFKNAPHKLYQFHDLNPDAAGPPRRLGAWLNAYLEDEDLPEHDEDDLPVKAGARRKLRRQT